MRSLRQKKCSQLCQTSLKPIKKKLMMASMFALSHHVVLEKHLEIND